MSEERKLVDIPNRAHVGAIRNVDAGSLFCCMYIASRKSRKGRYLYLGPRLEFKKIALAGIRISVIIYVKRSTNGFNI